jgi:hypothetical protein
VSSDGVQQRIEIHTSCSRNLVVGDVFGSLVLVGFANSNGVYGASSAQCPTATYGGGSTNSNYGTGSVPVGGDYNGGGVVIGATVYNGGGGGGGGIIIGGGGADTTVPVPDDTTVAPGNGGGGGGAPSCTYSSVCEAVSAENKGQIRSISLQLNLSNAALFQNSQGGFGIQQVYPGEVGKKVRVRIGGVMKNVWTLNDGDVFQMNAQAYAINKLPAQLSFLVIGSNKAKARIKFQTNCKRREIAIGDIFGVFTVVGYATKTESCETKQISNALTDSSLSGAGDTAAAVTGGAVAGVVVGVLLIVVIVAGVWKVTKSGGDNKAVKVTLSSTHDKASDLAWDEQQERDAAMKAQASDEK